MRIKRMIPFLLSLAVASTAAAGRTPFDQPEPHGQPGGETKAWELLLRAMERSRFIAAVGVVSKQGGMGTDCNMELKLEQSADGRTKWQVMSPLSMQGTMTLDDGHQWMTYWPDDRRLMIQPSPRLGSEDPRSKIKVAFRNYDLKNQGACKVAGRDAVRLKAEPKFQGMPARWFYMDSHNNFLLRTEVQQGQERKTLFDTKVIRFNTEVNENSFVFSSERAKVETYIAPMTVHSLKAAKAVVGFKPVVAQNLPYGFTVQAPQLSGQKQKFVAIRLTDGFANATLYQWDAHKTRQPFGVSSRDKVKEANGIRMQLVGDVPEVVLARLLDAFIKEALKNINPLMIQRVPSTEEPDRFFKALNSTKEESGEEWRSRPLSTLPALFPVIDPENQ